MKIKIKMNYFIRILISGLIMVSLFGCTEKLDAPFEDETFTSDVDYTIGEDVILPLLGAYEMFYDETWDGTITYSLRGDDVNAAGDQVPMQEQDQYLYMASHWNLNGFWGYQYNAIITSHTSMDEIEKYRPAVNNDALVEQYLAECRVINAWEYYTLANTFGGCIIVDELDNIQNTPVSYKPEVMQFIIDEMEEVIPLLLPLHPRDRTDVPGGITKFTALAIQAKAYLELEDYQGVADATAEIINSDAFGLFPDFYDLFNRAGKLANENVLEWQFSAYNTGEGPEYRHGFNPYGLAWNPVRTGAGGGWNFYEPTKKYIKFMLDRGETVRLEKTVHWTPDGMAEIESEWGTLPAWINNFNREGDEFINNARKKWGAGKWIQPSTELIEGRTAPGSNKNLIVIRYSEILLMYAEALTRGASSGIAMSADEAVNMVRERVDMDPLSGVTTQQVLDEKYAELATEWGIRFFDMVRTGNTSALSYEGRTFTMDKAFMPFPADQVSDLPQLAEGNE